MASPSVKESSAAPSPAVSDPGDRGGVPSRPPQALCRAQVPQRAADDLALAGGTAHYFPETQGVLNTTGHG